MIPRILLYKGGKSWMWLNCKQGRKFKIKELKKVVVVCKLDVEKAYNHGNWNFLL